MPLVPPFLRSGPRSSAMATWVLLALLVPSACYSVLYASPFFFKLVGYTLLGMVAESCYTLLVNRRLRLGGPGSGVTAALMAASVPPNMPFLPMLYAIFFAVCIIKLPNRRRTLRFNAAMTGRLFLMLVYPQAIVAWGIPSADVISTATPQELYRGEGFALDWPTLLFKRIGGNWEDLFQLVPGSPGETFPLIVLLLGLILCWMGVIAWRTPVAFLLSFGVATAAFGHSPLFNLFSAAPIFCAVFIASDPVSTPMSKGGQIAGGIIMGISNALIRNLTYYTEAVVYAVLIGNLFTPWLDRIAFSLQGWRLNQRTKPFN